MADWPFFGYLVYTVFGEGLNSVCLSEQLANIIMISEEIWENYEISLKNVYGHREYVIKRYEECSLHIVFVIFCFMGILAYHKRKQNGKIMETDH